MTAPDSLSARMLAAAETIDELNARLQYGPQSAWAPRSLRDEAPYVEGEDQEAAERDAVVEELARELYAANCKEKGGRDNDFYYNNVRDIYMRIARELIESGWTKA